MWKWKKEDNKTNSIIEKTNVNENTNTNDNKETNNIVFLNKIYKKTNELSAKDFENVTFEVTKYNKDLGIIKIIVNDVAYELNNSEIIETEDGIIYCANYEDLTLNMTYKSDDSFSIRASITQNSKMSDNDNNKEILKLAGVFK